MNTAIIWGHDKHDTPYSCHHMFWEQALYDNHLNPTRYTWDDWHTMPDTHDLYLFIDFHPSLYRLPPNRYHPRVFYWWDSFHLTYTYIAGLAPHFDINYYAEKPNVDAAIAQGITNVRWLPCSYYNHIFQPIHTDKLFDWAFVGQLDDVMVRKGHTRKSLLYTMATVSGLYGLIRDDGAYGHGLNRIYNQSRTLIDRTIHNNIGTRFFETIGSGGLLLANTPLTPNGLEEIAIPNVHYLTYDDEPADLIDKLRYYIDHPAQAHKIAQAGQAHLAQHHTYAHRIQQILRELKIYPQTVIKPRPAKTLEPLITALHQAPPAPYTPAVAHTWTPTYWATYQHNTGHTYYHILAKLVQHLQPRKILELGTSGGFSTLAMYSTMAPTSTITTIDTGPDTPLALLPHYTDPRLRIINGSDLDPAIIRSLDHDYDLLFIDTEHTVEQITQEWQIYTHRLAPGAIIALDDIHSNQGMTDFWNNLNYPKVDLGRDVHIDGFGILQYTGNYVPIVNHERKAPLSQSVP